MEICIDELQSAFPTLKIHINQTDMYRVTLIKSEGISPYITVEFTYNSLKNKQYIMRTLNNAINRLYKKEIKLQIFNELGD